MNRQAAVRIKGSRWEAIAGAQSAHPASYAEDPLGAIPVRAAPHDRAPESGTLLLDLAVHHFRGLQLSTVEARRLAHALRRCLDGEPTEVGPVSGTGRVYRFRRHARSVRILVGEAC